MSRTSDSAFADRILAFYGERARELPWRRTREPYAIWVSEIMAQQTRIETVIPYFERWMKLFPTIEALANAPLDDVLAAWSGLGYYSRARNIHRCAQQVSAAGGSLPQGAAELRALPGIGRYTAGAIASQAFGKAEPVVDGNVERVLARIFEIEGDIKSTAAQKELWKRAEELVPIERPGDYNQGLMELGQAVCTPRSPNCHDCPVADMCQAREKNRQNELPVRKARKKREDKPLIAMTATWLLRGKSLLFGKRPASGLYGGLWEVPQAAEKQRLKGELPGLVLAETSETIHEQELSHRRLRIEVFRGKLPRKPPAALDYVELRYWPLTEIDSLGVSSATAAIAKAMSRSRDE